jgi:hypothetical protein
MFTFDAVLRFTLDVEPQEHGLDEQDEHAISL